MEGYTGTPRQGHDVGLACRPVESSQSASTPSVRDGDAQMTNSNSSERAVQTGSKGTSTVSTSVQTSPRREVRERQRGTQVTPEKALHRHIKTVTIYPNGMREEKEEFFWYSSVRQRFPCCKDEPYVPPEVNTYRPTPIVVSTSEDPQQPASPTVNCSGNL